MLHKFIKVSIYFLVPLLVTLVVMAVVVNNWEIYYEFIFLVVLFVFVTYALYCLWLRCWLKLQSASNCV